MAEVFRKDVPIVATEFQVINRTGVTRTKRTGTVPRELAVATFDTAANDSAGVANTAIGAHGLGVYLPTKAIVTRAWYDNVTAPDSAAHTATIAIKIQAANDLKTATLVSDATFTTLGANEGVPDGTAAKMIKLTAVREIVVTTAVQVLTAGKLNIYVEYVLSD